MIAQAPGRSIDDALPRRRSVLGVRVDDVTWDETLSAVARFVASGEPHQVVTPNPEMVMAARTDPPLRTIIDRADLAPCDGVGLKWAAARLGQPIREVVPGSDLVPRMADGAASRGERWFLLGAADGVAEAAAAALVGRAPGLVVSGVHAGSPDPVHDDAICRLIEKAAPIDVLLVAYGAPAQEEWIARNQPRLRVPVAVGVGGTFNFLAGTSRVAPRWVQRAGLIWLFRLATEPWRWRRQLALARFVGLVLAEAARPGARGASGPEGKG